MKLQLFLAVIATITCVLRPLHAYAESITIQAVIELPEARAAIDVTCHREEDCLVQVGGFIMRLSLGRSGVGVRVSDEASELVFFDGTPRTSVSYSRSPLHLNLFDPNSDDYVVNGSNRPVGSIRLAFEGAD